MQMVLMNLSTVSTEPSFLDSSDAIKQIKQLQAELDEERRNVPSWLEDAKKNEAKTYLNCLAPRDAA